MLVQADEYLDIGQRREMRNEVRPLASGGFSHEHAEAIYSIGMIKSVPGRRNGGCSAELLDVGINDCLRSCRLIF